MDDEQTPTERPTLPANVPYIRAIGHLALQLSALNSNLSGIVHEMRVSRQPVVETGLAGKLRAAFATLRDIATSGESAFTVTKETP